MSNKPKPGSIEIGVTMLTGLYMDILAFDTKDDVDCNRATKITERIDEIKGFDFNAQNGRLQVHIGYCPKCEESRAGKDELTDTGECSECGTQTEEAKPVFLSLNGKDIDLLWDIVKPQIKGKRKIAVVKKVKAIAKVLGKAEDFDKLMEPDEEEEDAGSDPAEASPEG